MTSPSTIASATKGRMATPLKFPLTRKSVSEQGIHVGAEAETRCFWPRSRGLAKQTGVDHTPSLNPCRPTALQDAPRGRVPRHRIHRPIETNLTIPAGPCIQGPLGKDQEHLPRQPHHPCLISRPRRNSRRTHRHPLPPGKGVRTRHRSRGQVPAHLRSEPPGEHIPSRPRHEQLGSSHDEERVAHPSDGQQEEQHPNQHVSSSRYRKKANEGVQWAALLPHGFGLKSTVLGSPKLQSGRARIGAATHSVGDKVQNNPVRPGLDARSVVVEHVQRQGLPATPPSAIP